MLKNHCKSVAALAGALTMMLFSGCKDDSLDLSDIDTKMKFEIDNLVLPLKLDPIEFDDMVDLADTEGIEIINGEYVLLKKGEFSSQEINIRDIQSDATMEFEPPTPVEIPMIAGQSYPLSETEFPFSYSYNNVDKYIKRIDSGKVDLTLNYIITAKDGNRPMNCTFRNMTFELPKGFYGEVDNSITIDENSSNIVTVPDAKPNAEGEYIFTFHITSFDFKATGASHDGANFYLRAVFALRSGEIFINDGTGSTGSLSTHFDISRLEVKTFTGLVYYQIEELDPEEVSLGDLPDVLTDPKTSLSLRNPQLYISLTNPLSDDGVTASTGLTIRQVRPEGEEIIEAHIEDNKTDKEETKNRLIVEAKEGLQNFCLSPTEPASFYYEFPDATHYTMYNLGNIVDGKGLPQGLNINFIDPEMDEKEVVDFSLGQDLGTVNGEYTFFAPLELGTGSHIYYQEEATGWDLGGDDNELDIKKLAIKANCVSDLPVDVTITTHPLNSKGEEIKNVTINPVSVEAFAKNNPIEIIMEGDIKDLDGMRYIITVNANQDTSALKPTMSLKLDNLKVIVSGSMIIDEDDTDEYEY